jgi:nicotinate-nucleotide adenylyltransferase
MPPAERLGIFGGTFDPVHVGHLVAALEARTQLQLDRVLLIVAGDPWQKQGDVIAPAAARFEMVAASVEGVDGLEASRLEVDRTGPTYTVETVAELTAPGRDLFLVVGSDVASRLSTWHRAEDLRRAVTLGVVTRSGEPRPDLDGWQTAFVSMPRLDISSTDLRTRLTRDLPVDFLVPAAALRVIRDQDLYRNG